MSRIRGKDTKPELALRSLLWRQGLRYRLGLRVMGIRPDLVFPRQRVAVFVDGCFWHGCPLHYTRPRTSERFWAEKLRSNVTRDTEQTMRLESAGWRVVRVWEHAIWSASREVVDRIQLALQPTGWIPSEDWRVLTVNGLDEPRHEIEQVVLVRLRDPTCTRTIQWDRVVSRGTQWRR